MKLIIALFTLMLTTQSIAMSAAMVALGNAHIQSQPKQEQSVQIITIVEESSVETGNIHITNKDIAAAKIINEVCKEKFGLGTDLYDDCLTINLTAWYKGELK